MNQFDIIPNVIIYNRYILYLYIDIYSVIPIFSRESTPGAPPHIIKRVESALYRGGIQTVNDGCRIVVCSIIYVHKCMYIIR